MIGLGIKMRIAEIFHLTMKALLKALLRIENRKRHSSLLSDVA
jgi:hypothetical protein